MPQHYPPISTPSCDQLPSFIEILSTKQTSSKFPDFIDVYVSEILPSLCGKLVDEVSVFMSSTTLENTEHIETLREMDFPSLGHLRRVRRRVCTVNVGQTKSDDGCNSATETLGSFKDSTSTIVKLEVILSSVKYMDYVLSTSDETRQKWRNIVERYNLKVMKKIVSGRPAKSQEEMDEWNNRRRHFENDDEFHSTWWPTIFFSERTDEYLLRKLELTIDDVQYMRDGMMKAINDCNEHNAVFSYAVPGAVVISPSSKCVVASSFEERRLQTETLKRLSPGTNMELLEMNPLCTPILLAIQGVSRRERHAIGEANMNTDNPTGQYICTGYDLFTTKEPSIFEAMALVHARIRRVIFGSSNTLDGGLGGTGLDHAIHSLPGTNHHYRAFQCNPNLVNDLHALCEDL